MFNYKENQDVVVVLPDVEAESSHVEVYVGDCARAVGDCNVYAIMDEPGDWGPSVLIHNTVQDNWWLSDGREVQVLVFPIAE